MAPACYARALGATRSRATRVADSLWRLLNGWTVGPVIAITPAKSMPALWAKAKKAPTCTWTSPARAGPFSTPARTASPSCTWCRDPRSNGGKAGCLCTPGPATGAGRTAGTCTPLVGNPGTWLVPILTGNPAQSLCSPGGTTCRPWSGSLDNLSLAAALSRRPCNAFVAAASTDTAMRAVPTPPADCGTNHLRSSNPGTCSSFCGRPCGLSLLSSSLDSRCGQVDCRPRCTTL
jgi:hypothetical protein